MAVTRGWCRCARCRGFIEPSAKSPVVIVHGRRTHYACFLLDMEERLEEEENPKPKKRRVSRVVEDKKEKPATRRHLVLRMRRGGE
jgi:hypothetical protein